MYSILIIYFQTFCSVYIYLKFIYDNFKNILCNIIYQTLEENTNIKTLLFISYFNEIKSYFYNAYKYNYNINFKSWNIRKYKNKLLNIFNILLNNYFSIH